MEYKKDIENLFHTLKEFFHTRERVFEKVIELSIRRLKVGGKVLIFGNGGSAAQAQHFAAELVNKFLKTRPALPALSLTTDTSALTSIANDTSFDFVFSRQVEALGTRKDIAVGLSTSGNSLDVINAMKVARDIEMMTVAFTGKGGGELSFLVDYLLDAPSDYTPRIQEVHLFLLHLLAQEIEKGI